MTVFACRGISRAPLSYLNLASAAATAFFRFGSVGARHSRAEQRLERCLSVGSPAEPVERDGQVILYAGFCGAERLAALRYVSAFAASPWANKIHPSVSSI